MAGAEYVEARLGGAHGTNLSDEALQEAYTHEELERLGAENLYRFQNLYWARVCMRLAEKYFLRAAGIR